MKGFTAKRPGFRGQAVLAFGALAGVWSDIGTSPLFVMQEGLAHLPAGPDQAAAVIGMLSLMGWMLFLGVGGKYLLLVMRADNRGEGGSFALLAQLHADKQPAVGRQDSRFVVVMILAGAALFCVKGVLTPAISVLGAAEGLGSIDARWQGTAPWACAIILLAVFWWQSTGRELGARIQGWLMGGWFLVLAALGAWQVAQFPLVLRALDPGAGLRLLALRPGEGLVLLGAAALVVAGGETVFAGMGRFGRKPIALAWYGLVLPALGLNFLGQGAYVLGHPGSTANPFFALAPSGAARVGLLGLALAAALVASQALIAAISSLVRQAIQLGYFPRLKVGHGRADDAGQLYLPFVNGLMAGGCLLAVYLFGSTGGLAAAYGLAAMGAMTITTVAWLGLRWRRPGPMLAPAAGALFLAWELSCLAGQVPRIPQGGWFSLVAGVALLAMMHTWKTGRDEVFRRVYGSHVTDSELMGIADRSRIARVDGTAVFMAGLPRGTPVALLYHVKANHSLHRTVVLLSIITEEVPAVEPAERLLIFGLGEGIWRVVGRYGYMESPDVRWILDAAAARRVPIKPERAVYFFNREMIIAGNTSRMWRWEKHLYGFLVRNARPARYYYQLPPSQIIEIGLPVEL